MKTFCAIAAISLSLMGSVGFASAQSYGGRDYGYGDRDDRDRGRGSRDRDYDDRDRGRGNGERSRDYGDRQNSGGRQDFGGRQNSGGRQNGFDESAYIRCNPDVRQALANGQLTSAFAHYQKFGRREGRRLSC
ncbi:hypothetical protein G3T14_03130 [Methylobacterium sp. BTF04]|uniref:hypothetical protein n=1 Tax=Methylobacterium sp. BTF04 TaxID=2708300 RepID=UPI0013D108F0|nr:hypothetical protein [Methylobacterium sp. BTF04]NEU11122.1 hypothetical protein [Methylobacterium sp. BTF04]